MKYVRERRACFVDFYHVVEGSDDPISEHLAGNSEYIGHSVGDAISFIDDEVQISESIPYEQIS